MLNVLSENRDLQQQVKKAADMLTQISIEKMPYYQLGLERGVEKGIEQAKLTEKLKMAQLMLQEGFEIEIIVKITGISQTEILQLSH
jgi:predicted transposase/invertase (TIGR01784 family)